MRTSLSVGLPSEPLHACRLASSLFGDELPSARLKTSLGSTPKAEPCLPRSVGLSSAWRGVAGPTSGLASEWVGIRLRMSESVGRWAGPFPASGFGTLPFGVASPPTDLAPSLGRRTNSEPRLTRPLGVSSA